MLLEFKWPLVHVNVILSTIYYYTQYGATGRSKAAST